MNICCTIRIRRQSWNIKLVDKIYRHYVFIPCKELLHLHPDEHFMLRCVKNIVSRCTIPSDTEQTIISHSDMLTRGNFPWGMCLSGLMWKIVAYVNMSRWDKCCILLVWSDLSNSDDFKAGCFAGFNAGASAFDDGALGINFPWKIWFLKLETGNYHRPRKCTSKYMTLAKQYYHLIPRQATIVFPW